MLVFGRFVVGLLLAALPLSAWGQQVNEFWPGINRKVFHKHRPSARAR